MSDLLISRRSGIKEILKVCTMPLVLLKLAEKVTKEADAQNFQLQQQIAADGPAASGAASAAFVTGITAGSANNNVAYAVGMYITVGGAGISVVSLGRWKISGNSLTHVMHVRDSSGTDLGSGTVDLSTGSNASFVYVTLGTPIALSASTSYYIFSDEANGGDQWYWSDTTCTHTAVATVPTAAYYSGSVNQVSTIDHNWGPVSFKYT